VLIELRGRPPQRVRALGEARAAVKKLVALFRRILGGRDRIIRSRCRRGLYHSWWDRRGPVVRAGRSSLIGHVTNWRAPKQLRAPELITASARTRSKWRNCGSEASHKNCVAF